MAIKTERVDRDLWVSDALSKHKELEKNFVQPASILTISASMTVLIAGRRLA